MKHLLTSAAVTLFVGLHPVIADDASLLQKLKHDPTGNPAAASWFASLPLEKKREYAARIGHIVLEAAKGTEDESFVVAFGATRSPYPWAFMVGKGRNRLELCGGNSFYYVRRDDKWAKNKWGVYWIVKVEYTTTIAETSVTFRKAISKGIGFDLWIPGSGWTYVGPKLPKADWVLGRDAPPDK
jgi:hypothetical protein